MRETIYPRNWQQIREFLPPTNKVWGKVIFLHLSVILFTGGGSVMMPIPVIDSTTPFPQTAPPPRPHPGQHHPSPSWTTLPSWTAPPRQHHPLDNTTPRHHHPWTAPSPRQHHPPSGKLHPNTPSGQHPPLDSTPFPDQQAGGTHPTLMFSCWHWVDVHSLISWNIYGNWSSTSEFFSILAERETSENVVRWCFTQSRRVWTLPDWSLLPSWLRGIPSRYTIFIH